MMQSLKDQWQKEHAIYLSLIAQQDERAARNLEEMKREFERLDEEFPDGEPGMSQEEVDAQNEALLKAYEEDPDPEDWPDNHYPILVSYPYHPDMGDYPQQPIAEIAKANGANLWGRKLTEYPEEQGGGMEIELVFSMPVRPKGFIRNLGSRARQSLPDQLASWLAKKIDKSLSLDAYVGVLGQHGELFSEYERVTS
jgi:hypothetical protein